MEIGEDEMVGAIFMCNQTTKKECFRSKVFGLPSSYNEFVVKVKAGMLLFLFEYEERKLYGVFEATTDGAINISPSAFSKTTGTFPAQVIFKNVWKCYPLTENEFRGAIQDNYFAPYKFHFGLSHEQVSTLLDLFSRRKLIPKNQPSADYRESYRLENYNDVIRKERSASIEETDLESGLDYKEATYNQHSELVHKIHSTDMDLRDYLTRDRDKHRDRNSNEPHPSLDMNSKDKLVGKRTLYTHDPDLVFKNQGDLDNECRPHHISHCDYQPHSVTGSTSQLDYFPQDCHHLSPKTHLTYPNYGTESTSVTVAPQLVEPMIVPLKSHFYTSYPDLDNYRYSSTGYLKESNCSKISADVSNLAPKFTGAAYPLEDFLRSIPVKPPSDNPNDLPPLSTERHLNFDYDSLALKYSASNVMDYTPSLGSHSANILGCWKMHPESSKSACIDKSKIAPSMEATLDLTRYSLEPNSTAKNHDIVKRYCTRQQSSEPCDIKEFGTTTDHYRSIYPSEFSNANEYEGKGLELQSEMPERRSVFSRLSKTAKVKNICSTDDQSPSQLLNILAQRKKKWNKIASSPKSSHPSITHGTPFRRSKTWIRTKLIDDDLTKESKGSTKESTNLSVKKTKHRNWIESKDDDTKGHLKDIDLNNFEPKNETTKNSDVLDAFHEEAMKVLIKNFKRRSVTQEKTGGNAEKGKRRKLIRPSFINNDMEGIGNEGHLAIEANKNSTGPSTCKEYLVVENSRVKNENADVSFDQNSNRSIKVEPIEEENILASHIQNDKPNNTVEMTVISGSKVENKKTDVRFGQKLSIGIKVEPVVEEHMLLSHTHDDKPYDTNEMVENSGFQLENKKTEVNFGQKSNVSVKIEPIEEEHLLTAHTQNDMHKETTEMVESLCKDSEQVSESSVADNAIVLGQKVASSRVSVSLKNANKRSCSLKENVNDVHLDATNAERISSLKENVNDVHLDATNAERISTLKENISGVHLDDTNRADFGAESSKSSKENIVINSFKLPNLCIKTDEVKERLQNSSNKIAVKSENSSNLCMKTDQDKACFKAENAADLRKSSEENARMNSDKPTSRSTNSVENKILASERENNSDSFIDLNEVPTTSGVIAEEFHIEPDAAADF